MKKTKKCMAIVTLAALFAGSIGPLNSGSAYVRAAELPKLLVDFDFENLGDNDDITYENAKASGTYSVCESYVSGEKALSLNGKNQFLNVTNADGGSLLTGLKEFTISYEAKHDRSATNWIAYAAADTTSPEYGIERYIGIMQNNGKLSAERYHNTNGRPYVANTGIGNEWTHVDVVLGEEETVIYVNGQEKAREGSAYAVNELLGENSILQIGKANWKEGEFCQASIDNFRIYGKALTQEQITDQFNAYALERDAAVLTLPLETDRSLTLPVSGKSGLTTISWTSSNPDIMTNDGRITRGDENQVVTMTAIVKLGDHTVEKAMEITVLKKNPDEDIATYKKELTLNTGFVSDDIELPTCIGDAVVSWETSDKNIITENGKVTRGDKNREVTLTANIKVAGAQSDGRKAFPLTVLAKGNDVATYVSNHPVTGQKGGMKIAVKGEEGYEVLHKDQPILYSCVGIKSYTAPQIFRKADASFGVIAADGGNNGNIIIYDSKDLITYENQRLIAIPGISAIQKLYCVYDSADEVYKVFVQENGSVYLTTTKDFANFTEVKTVSYTFAELSNVPKDAVWAEREALTQKEYDTIVKQFKNPTNTKLTGIPENISISKGDDFQDKLNSEVKAEYSDGSEKTYSIRWNKGDIAKINTNRAGEYMVRGTIGGSAYYTKADEPLIEERADPYIVYDEERQKYYFTSSYPVNGKGGEDGYDRLILREADTIEELADAKESIIWDESEDNNSTNTGFNSYGRWIWAPELHKIGGSWYFVSTAGDDPEGGNFGIRPFMMRCNNPDDITNPDSWDGPQRVKPMPGDEKNCMNAMSLDMTYFEAGGNHYLVWADVTQGYSSLYIATIDPANPTQLTSNCEIITVPEYSWELERAIVNEGPAVIQKDGKVYLAFSASGTGMEYCVGLLTGEAKDDLTKSKNWVKTPYPILTSSDFNNEVCGPGHNSFTVDEFGNPVIVYHARPTEVHTTAGGIHNGDPLYDPCRHCYVKPVFFGVDGAPVLNLSDNEFAINSELSVKVTVEGKEEDRSPVLEYNFDETYTSGTAKDTAGENNAVLSEGASYVWDDEYGQVLYLDGNMAEGGHNSYLEFPQGFFDRKDSVTISMDVKEVTRSGNYFTFTVGQDNQKYLFLKTEPTKTKLAITTGSYQKEKIAQKSGAYPNNSQTWINVKMVVTPQSISLYRDGKLIAENNNSGISMTVLGDNLKAYLGKSFYNEDKYFRGYFDNVKVYDWAMSDREVKKITKEDETARKKVMGEVELVAEKFVIPNAGNIKGNITLPSQKDGVLIKWTSSNEDIISTKSVKNKGYDTTPAGVVTRQEKDTKVTLTAVFSKEGCKDVTKDYEVIVKAIPEEIKEDNYVGYLFVRFTGNESSISHEQTYFSLSRDGLNWENLNEDQPILTSTFGESGLRDHYIARSPEGDKFYMIATDLSIYQNNRWMEAGANGSHSIVVWESDDLVNWSNPWLAEIAPEGAGCTWAPEFIYDEKTGEYVVFWAATTLKVDGEENITQEYENHAIYYCKTRDFRTFTEAKLYHEGGTGPDGKVVKVIDSTMIENNGTYYRYTKNESNGTIEIDKSNAVLGEFTPIESKNLSVNLPNAQGAVEGPIIFKLNEKSADKEEQWCLMVDRFARGQGYYPLITTDLESGEFKMLEDSAFSFPSKYRHGYVIPVTAAEYSALQRKWGSPDYVDTYLLEETIRKAEAVLSENYTEESFANLQTALEIAKAVLETVASTAEADAAAHVLQETIDALVPVVQITLASIQVTAPNKIEYEVGEELNLAGLKVTAVYSNGFNKDVTKEVKISGFDSAKVGRQTITVTYEDKTDVFEVTVKEKEDSSTGTDGKDDDSTDTTGSNNTNVEDKNDQGVETGDAAQTGVWWGLVTVALAVILVLTNRRKRLF